MTTLLIRLVRHSYQILGGFLLIEHSYDYLANPACTPGMKYYLGALVNGQSFDDPCNRLGRLVYSPKNLGYPESLPLYPSNPGMTHRTLDSQSYKDPELVKVKMTIGHVRPGLQGLNEGLTQRLCGP